MRRKAADVSREESILKSVNALLLQGEPHRCLVVDEETGRRCDLDHGHQPPFHVSGCGTYGKWRDENGTNGYSPVLSTPPAR
jgi:hypothetical protein